MSRRHAFTLVELLTVIAIIAILIALLLPALKSAKRQVDKTVCAANLHQIGTAFLLYAQDYKGWMPATARQPLWYNGDKNWLRQDWIHWQAGRDITQSALWPYLRGSKVLVCPSGIPERGPAYVYPFSYSLNRGMAVTPGGDGHCNLRRVIQPWHKLMVVEEDSLTINDGEWLPSSGGPYPRMPPGESLHILSARHDLNYEYDRPRGIASWYAIDFGRGHGVCADGSYAFVKRWDAIHEYWTDPDQIGSPPKPPS